MHVLICDGSQRMNLAKKRMKKAIEITEECSFDEPIDLILPIKGINEQGIIFGTKIKLHEIIKKNNVRSIITGFANRNLVDLKEKYNFELKSIFSDPLFMDANSQITAWGLLGIILSSMDQSIHQSSVLILGYGNTGKAIAKLFSKIFRISVYSRHYNDKYSEESCLENINEYDIVINTIPSLVLSNDILIDYKGIIYDIASYPGGLDHEMAKKMNIKTRLELEIPGRLYPEFSSNELALCWERLLSN